MNSRYLIALIFAFAFLFCLTSCHKETYQISECEKAVNQIVNQGFLILKERHQMIPVGDTVAMPGRIVKFFGLEFKIHGPLEKEKLRSILIDSAHELLSIINKNEDIQSCLETYPFTIKNIEIVLFIIDSNRRNLHHPYIGIAQISKGELKYLTLDEKDDIPLTVTEQRENYKDALSKLSFS